jgi:hypothetical protein
MLELEGLFSFNLRTKSVRTAKVTEMTCFFNVIFGKKICVKSEYGIIDKCTSSLFCHINVSVN